jgi:tetratricopeptide (TPR) repeat protein
MPRVFISHSSLDRDLVEREIVAPLKGAGVEVWYSRDSIETASEWEKRIKEGLRGSDWFLVALSPRSVASKWVFVEVDWALEHRGGRVVPVMLETCDPTDLHLMLRPLQYIDFRADAESARGKLLGVWAGDVARQLAEQQALQLAEDRARRIDGLLRIAHAALKAKDWPVAEANLAEVLRLDPAHAEAREVLERVGRLRAGEQRAGAAGSGRLEEPGGVETDATTRAEAGPPPPVTGPPAVAATPRAPEVNDWASRQLGRARELAGRGNWIGATQELKALLASRQSPHLHEEARSLLSDVERRRLSELYERGKAHLKDQNWGAAFQCFAEIKAINPRYQNVNELSAKANREYHAAQTAAQREPGDTPQQPPARVEKIAAPPAEKNKPAEAKSKPVEQKTKPAGEKTKPIEEKTKPVEEKAKPVGEKTNPVGEKTEPVEGKTKAAVEKVKRQPIRGRETAAPSAETQSRSGLYKSLWRAKQLSAQGDWAAARRELRFLLFMAPADDQLLQSEARALLADIEVKFEVPLRVLKFADGKKFYEAQKWKKALPLLREVKSALTPEGEAALKKALGGFAFIYVETMIRNAERAAARRRARVLWLVALAVVLLAAAGLTVWVAIYGW